MAREICPKAGKRELSWRNLYPIHHVGCKSKGEELWGGEKLAAVIYLHWEVLKTRTLREMKIFLYRMGYTKRPWQADFMNSNKFPIPARTRSITVGACYMYNQVLIWNVLASFRSLGWSNSPMPAVLYLQLLISALILSIDAVIHFLCTNWHSNGQQLSFYCFLYLRLRKNFNSVSTVNFDTFRVWMGLELLNTLQRSAIIRPGLIECDEMRPDALLGQTLRISYAQGISRGAITGSRPSDAMKPELAENEVAAAPRVGLNEDAFDNYRRRAPSAAPAPTAAASPASIDTVEMQLWPTRRISRNLDDGRVSGYIDVGIHNIRTGSIDHLLRWSVLRGGGADWLPSHTRLHLVFHGQRRRSRFSAVGYKGLWELSSRPKGGKPCS